MERERADLEAGQSSVSQTVFHDTHGPFNKDVSEVRGSTSSINVKKSNF